MELQPAENETTEDADNEENGEHTDGEADDTTADETNTPAAPQYKYILHITVTSRSVDELAADFRFTQDQNDILHELLSDEMRPTLVTLCGITNGAADIPTDGSLQWPLPSYTTLSCQFGEVDAFGRAGHRGIDISPPAGTPILAAHDGTVLIAGWNDSYALPFSQEECGAKFYMNREYLCRLFTKELGVSMVNYLNEVRIRHAKELLANDAFPIKEIAHQVGYEDEKYFARQFKRQENATPAEYRNRLIAHWAE